MCSLCAPAGDLFWLTSPEVAVNLCLVFYTLPCLASVSPHFRLRLKRNQGLNMTALLLKTNRALCNILENYPPRASILEIKIRFVLSSVGSHPSLGTNSP